MNAPKKFTFTDADLALLKPIIAQPLVAKEMAPLINYAAYSDNNLSIKERIKKRTINCLKISKALASCGSFNCEIANLGVCLALINKVSTPIELVNFSGARDDGKDTQHTFITIGCTNSEVEKALLPALTSLRSGKRIDKDKFSDYICM